VLFVYGTLLFPDVLQAVLGRVPIMTPASLPGWRAAALPGRVYPGLVPATDGSGRGAAGQVLTGLSAGEWAVLDAFEGDAYDRRELVLGDDRQVWTYVWCDGAAVAAHDWDPAWFARTELPTYVDGCVSWRDDLT